MGKFETVGCSIQESALSKEWAQKQFQKSCYICCLKGLQIDCDKCSIQACHRLVIAALESGKEVK